MPSHAPFLLLLHSTTGEGFVLSVKTDVAMGDAYVGCSIAVNGVCLTATTIDPANKVRSGWQL